MWIYCSSEIFQREISKALLGIPGQINISDEILVFAYSPEEHDQIIRQVIERLNWYGLTVNSKKCEFKKNNLVFGMKFSKDGISADPDKTDAIRSAPEPHVILIQNRKLLGSTFGWDWIRNIYFSNKFSKQQWAKIETVPFDCSQTLKKGTRLRAVSYFSLWW